MSRGNQCWMLEDVGRIGLKSSNLQDAESILEDLEQCFSGTPNCKAQKLKHSFVPWELLVLSVGKLKIILCLQYGGSAQLQRSRRGQHVHHTVQNL